MNLMILMTQMTLTNLMTLMTLMTQKNLMTLMTVMTVGPLHCGHTVKQTEPQIVMYPNISSYKSSKHAHVL